MVAVAISDHVSPTREYSEMYAVTICYRGLTDFGATLKIPETNMDESYVDLCFPPREIVVRIR